MAELLPASCNEIPEGTDMMKTVILLAAAVWLLGGCAGMSAGESRRNDTISRASTCAMCGASVSPGYLYYSTDRSLGPGHGW